MFHKNDGYQTPIVINPFRDEGNIDINSESVLVKDRLMYNMIVNEDLLQITSNNKITKLAITKKNPYNVSTYINVGIFPKDDHYKKFISSLISFYNSNFKDGNSNFRYNEVLHDDLNYIEQESLNYIIRKLKRITQNYKIYNRFRFNESNIYSIDINEKNISKITGLLALLEKDKSHITNKIRQAINFIFINRISSDVKDEIYSFYIANISPQDSSEKSEPFDFKNFANIIKERSERFKIDIINLLPPPIFEVDYEFDNGSQFSQLSSGEKQQIFSLNSILYHLINLNSTESNDFEFKYPYINLILDEIELYAHPDMQRKYIKELLAGISKLKIDKIESINILFITHSPFILSDIPKQNILFLDNGNPQDYKRMNTFGANITDLLADSFFINDGLMGDFAKSKIENTIKWINLEKLKKDSKLQEPYQIEVKEFNLHKQIIELIDEPVLKIKLAEMLDELKDGKEFQKELAKKEIEYLKSKFGL